MRASSSAMVSSEVDEILPLKVVQSALVRRPRFAAEALGILSCTVPPSAVEAEPQLMSEPVEPVVYEVVAVVRPLLPRVPVIVGAKVTVFPVAVIKSAILSPLNELVVEAKVMVGPLWIEAAGPTPVIAPARRPRVLVATHLVEVPVVWRICPAVPALFVVSRRAPRIVISDAVVEPVNVDVPVTANVGAVS
jgi:hypothetical protein